MSIETVLTHSKGNLTLFRHPRRRNETLRAWDGADRFLLHHRLEQCVKPLLVVNDEFGALALASPESHSWNDSWLAQLNWLENARCNELELSMKQWHWQLDDLPKVGEVWLKVPKQLALLEWQLQQLNQQLPAGVPVYLAWLDKHIPSSLVDLVKHYLADVDLLRGRFKAHGLVGYTTQVEVAPLNTYPTKVLTPYFTEPLICHAGVFAQQQLDIGSRFMLEHLPEQSQGTIVDLACGSGVLGLVAAQQNPEAEMVFADESWLAIKSAKQNWQRFFADRAASFHHGNGLAAWSKKADLILLNPPFHRGHIVDPTMALPLFKQAAKSLTKTGELWVVGNRHLAYHKRLKRWFKQVELVAEHPKFVLLRAHSVK